MLLDTQHRSRGQILYGMRHGDFPFFYGMSELIMIAVHVYEFPAVGLKFLYYFMAIHSVHAI